MKKYLTKKEKILFDKSWLNLLSGFTRAGLLALLGFGLFSFASTVAERFQFRGLLLRLVQLGPQTADDCHCLVCTFHWSTSHFILFYRERKNEKTKKRKILFDVYFTIQEISQETCSSSPALQPSPCLS